MPHIPGQVGALGIFEEDGQATTTVKVEKEGSVLKIIDPSPRGGPGTTMGDSGRDLIPFEMHHFQIDDAVMADEVQGVRELGGDANTPETLQGRIEKKQERHAMSMDLTIEHSRVGAIKGIVTSGSGATLHDLYSRFDLAVPAPVDLGIINGTEVAGLDTLLDDQVRFAIEDELDEAYDHIHVLTGREIPRMALGSARGARDLPRL
ncbi:MAG: major capsid protein [Paracoccaceae bacterium]